MHKGRGFDEALFKNRKRKNKSGTLTENWAQCNKMRIMIVSFINLHNQTETELNIQHILYKIIYKTWQTLLDKDVFFQKRCVRTQSVWVWNLLMFQKTLRPVTESCVSYTQI